MIKTMLIKVWESLFPSQKSEYVVNPDFVQVLKDVQAQKVFAEKYFNSVDDPDLMDFASYSLMATERKYVYLLRQAKKEGISIAFNHTIESSRG